MTLTEMRDYVIGSGWDYNGTCGCSINMYKYSKPTSPNYEIRIGVNVDTFEIRHHGRTMKKGNGTNFLQYYGEVFP